MKAEVETIGLSVKLHYGIKEDLLFVGADGESQDLFLNEWAVGTRKDILDSAIRLLATIEDDATVVIGVVPNLRPSTGDMKGLEDSEASGEPEED